MQQLLKILPPPENPYNTGTKEEWGEITKKLGTDLPSDYKEFINTYGTGGLDNFLWILTPFVDDENINLFKKQKVLSNSYLISKENAPDYFKHNIYPEKDGLLAWAYTDNGDELYWLTNGKPDDWKVVVYESASPENRTYSLNMTEFLYQVLDKKIQCSAFPEDFPSESYKFVSVSVD